MLDAARMRRPDAFSPSIGGWPELGYVSLAEIQSVRGKLGLPIERDLYFIAKHPLSHYAKRARDAGRIVTD